MSISSIKKILLAGTALVAVAAFGTQAQAAAGANGTSSPISNLAALTAATTGGSAGTSGAPVAGDASGNPGGLGLVMTGGTITGTLGATVLGGNGGQDSTLAAAAVGPGAGGVGYGFGTQTGNVITFGASTGLFTVTGGSGGNENSLGAAALNLSTMTTAAGGVGILVDGITNTVIDNDITTGGTGSLGGSSSNNLGANGGIGGIGISSTATGNTIDTNAAVNGGHGGLGGTSVTGAVGSHGGNGAAAINLGGATNTLSATANLTGGIGGTGGINSGGGDTGGVGGLGGDAVDSSSTGAIITFADGGTPGKIVAGGAGGVGGNGTTAGSGGNGGMGVDLTGTGATVNVGVGVTVQGGLGGAVGTGAAGTAGTAGVGITMAGATTNDVENSGTIIGGNSGAVSAISVTNATTTSGTIHNALTGAVIGGTGAGDGINIGTTAVLTAVNNILGGTIETGTGKAIDLTGVASTVTTLTNAGTITAGAGTAVYDGGVITTLNNSGLISVTGGGGAALDVEHAGMTTFSNTGVIKSTNATGEAINLGVDNVAGITNAGSISNTSAADNGIALSIAHSQTGTFTNSGIISSVGVGGNTGKAVFFNAATAALTNSGTITGTITDNASANVITLTNSGAGSINGAITITDTGAGSSLTTSGTSFITGNVGFTGAAAHTFTFGSTGTLNGTLTGGSAVDTLNLNAPLLGGASAGTITGIIDLGAGANVVKVGDGTATAEEFTTSNTIQESGGGTLNTEVNTNGTFNVGNTYTAGLGTLQVDAGGKLNLTGGTFTAGALTNNGAITINTAQSMGVNSIATGTGTDTFQVKAGSTLIDGTNGVLAATTTAAVNATNILVKVDPTSGIIQNHAQFEVITSGTLTPTAITTAGTLVATVGMDKFYAVLGGSALTGSFAGITSIGASVNDVDVIAVQQSLTTLGSAITANDAALFNALSTASAADAACVTAACTQLKAAITAVNVASGVSATAAHNALQSLMPAGADGGAQSAALDVGADIQSIETGRIMALRDGDTTSGVAAGASSHGVSMWAEGYGQHANQDTLDGVNGYGATTWGGAVGVDSSAMLDKAIVGVALNYGHSAIDSKDANTTTTDLGNYGINLYGSYDLGQRMFVNGQVGFAYNTIDSDRHNAGGAGGPTAVGSTSSDQYSARLDTGRDYPVAGGLTLTPDVSAAYTYLNTAGYTETGAGGLDNTVASNSQNVLGLGIGGTAAWKMHTPDDDVIKPSLHAGYTYEAIDDRVSTSSSFAGDPAGTIFINEGSSPARSVFDVGAKVVYSTKANWDLSANYDFQAKTSYTSNTGVLRATAHF